MSRWIMPLRWAWWMARQTVAHELHFLRQAHSRQMRFVERLTIDKLHRDVGLAFDLADLEDIDRWPV
jgi:hypothetical protein